ncbi:hypothetical protein [Rhizobium sp. BR 362]|uniref:hypothetical protein n=1 Tax=Rhizobium sp. BR 362 TaxID=3040670 RepID=UPI002F40B394
MFYSLSGDSPPPAKAEGMAAGMVRRNGDFLTNPVSLPSWLTESDIDIYVEAFTRSGFRGSLNWWRNIDRSWELMGAFSQAQVTVPALYIAGDRDIIVEAFQPIIAKQSAMVPKLRPAIMLRAVVIGPSRNVRRR